MTVWRPLSYKSSPPPLKVVGGKGAAYVLEDGREIINLISSWWYAIHGHGHHEIADAIYDQARAVEHVNLSDFTVEVTERLSHTVLQLLPPHFAYTIYSDSGSTSVEVALKLALHYWHNVGQPKQRFLAFEGGYHGDTFGAMSVGRDDDFHRPYLNHLFPIDQVPYPATYIGDETVEEKEMTSLQLVERHLTQQHYAAIIIEPLVQGAGGMRMIRPQFLQKLQRLAKEHETVVIYDEVMTGFGRTGDWFACNKAQTQPDIICLSKALTGGVLPAAMTVCTKEIHAPFESDDPDKLFWHSTSFAGNSIACAAALKSLELLKNEPFRKIESQHHQHLTNLPNILRPRILGTIAAFDLPTNSQEGYFNTSARPLKTAMLERGFYLRPLGNTLYLLPPYCITDAQLSAAYQALAELLA